MTRGQALRDATADYDKLRLNSAALDAEVVQHHVSSRSTSSVAGLGVPTALGAAAGPGPGALGYSAHIGGDADSELLKYSDTPEY